MRSQRRAWKVAAVVVLLLAAFSVSQTARAASPGDDPRDKFLSGNSVTIPSDVTVAHDLYVTGSAVRIDGRVDGDLFVLDGTVDVNGPVSGDLFVLGGTATISGPVGRHLRAAGGTVTVRGDVQQDLIVAAGTLNVESPAHIGGDLIFTAGQTELGGTVDGSVLGSTQTYDNAGSSVAGTESVTLRPQSPQRAQPPSAASRLLDQVRRYLSILLVGVLLVALAPRLSAAAETQGRHSPLPSLGLGLVAFVGLIAILIGLFIGTVVLTIILGVLGFGQIALAVVFGGLLGTAGLGYLFYLLTLFAAVAVAALILGQVILERTTQPWARGPYVALLLGVLLLVVVAALPIVGGILNAVAVVFGTGALVLAVSSGRRVAPPPAEPLPA